MSHSGIILSLLASGSRYIDVLFVCPLIRGYISPNKAPHTHTNPVGGGGFTPITRPIGYFRLCFMTVSSSNAFSIMLWIFFTSLAAQSRPMDNRSPFKLNRRGENASLSLLPSALFQLRSPLREASDRRDEGEPCISGSD